MGSNPQKFKKKKFFLKERKAPGSSSILNTASFFNVCLMTIWLLGCQSFLTKCSIGLPKYIASESNGAADLFHNNLGPGLFLLKANLSVMWEMFAFYVY